MLPAELDEETILRQHAKDENKRCFDPDAPPKCPSADEEPVGTPRGAPGRDPVDLGLEELDLL